MDARTRALLLAVQVFFGIFPWLGKVALEAFEPRALLVWRLFTGAVVLFGYALLRHGRAAIPPAASLLRLFVLSLLGVTINQWLFLEGLSRSTAVNAGLLMATIPVATAALAAAAGSERITPRRQVGIALGVLGVAWLFVTRGAGLGSATLAGDLLLTLNALSYSGYLVLAKSTLERLPRSVVLAWVFVFGALTAPLVAAGADCLPELAARRHWLALLGVLLFPTILAYLGNIVVLARTEASTTAAYILLQPLVAGTLGILLLGERPDAWLAVSAAAVFAGLWLVSTPGRARPSVVLSPPSADPASCADRPRRRTAPR